MFNVVGDEQGGLFHALIGTLLITVAAHLVMGSDATRPAGEVTNSIGMTLKRLEAGEFLMMLRLRHQVEQARAGRPVSNYVNPESLSHLQRALLHFRQRLEAR